MKAEESPVRADAALMGGIAALVANPEEATGIGQDRADRLLARIVWTRLLEPGDRIAGQLSAALGAEELLRLVATGASARRILTAAADSRAGIDPDLSPRSIAAALQRWTPRLDRAKTVADIELGVARGLRLLDPESALWPDALADLGPHAPIALWTSGDPRHLSARSLAVVGARAATGYGVEVTAEIVEGVCSAGIPIVSGAAYGIDAAAHRTALALSSPTVAVLAGGLDRPYPESHRELLGRIAESGTVCSELAPGSAPTRWRFLQRNRLIAALSAATLVTEAGVRSGSLNTAGHAAETGRPLGAVPGPVTSSASSGCHLLIREYGAALVSSSSEALELVGVADGDASLLGLADPASPAGAASGPASGAASGPASGLASASSSEAAVAPRQPAAHRRVLDALPLRGSRSLPEIAESAGLTREETSGAIAELELLGFVSRRETPSDPEIRWALERRQ